jgi:cation transport ATPase
VTALILLGRYFEACAKRRSGAALRALLSPGSKDVAVLGDDAEVGPDRAAGRLRCRKGCGDWHLTERPER